MDRSIAGETTQRIQAIFQYFFLNKKKHNNILQLYLLYSGLLGLGSVKQQTIPTIITALNNRKYF